jgi:hypothetical protein
VRLYSETSGYSLKGLLDLNETIRQPFSMRRIHVADLPGITMTEDA